jgi:hypothetical protein
MINFIAAAVNFKFYNVPANSNTSIPLESTHHIVHYTEAFSPATPKEANIYSFHLPHK